MVLLRKSPDFFSLDFNILRDYWCKQVYRSLMTMQMTYSYLYKLGDGSYEYWARTDNRFDSNYTTLFLGVNEETAIKTLIDLKYLMENEVAGVKVQQEDGNVYLTFAKQLGARMLWIKQDGQGGRSWISLQMVNDLIKYFEEQLEPKGQAPAKEQEQESELW